MRDNSEVRKHNKKKIRQELRKNIKASKQQMSNMTGLSVATCNTLLNEMESEGEVISEKSLTSKVGRSTSIYSLNEHYGLYLCLEFSIVKTKRVLTWNVMTIYEHVLERSVETHDFLDESMLLKVITDIRIKYPRICSISIGTPSIAEHNIIKYCDISELEGSSFVKELSLPVAIENDMHLKAYGYFKAECVENEIVTLGLFSEHLLPGTSTIVKGHIIRGANQIAGLVGFLPFGISREELKTKFSSDSHLEFTAKSIVSIIVALNPHKMILCGDLLNLREVELLKTTCANSIPEEYLPTFVYVEDMEKYYVRGMFHRALEVSEEYEHH